MNQFEQEKRRAESGGMAGARDVSRGLSDTGTSVALVLYKRIILNVQRLKDARKANQERVAEVGSRLASSPTAELTTERELLEKPAEKAEVKPLIDYANSGQEKTRLVEQIRTTTTAFERNAKSSDSQVASEAQLKVVELARLVGELGISTYIERSVRSTMQDSTFFSDRKPTERESGVVEAKTAQQATGVRQQTAKDIIDVEVEASDIADSDEELFQTEAVPQRPKLRSLSAKPREQEAVRTVATAAQSSSELSEAQQKVVKIVDSISASYEEYSTQLSDTKYPPQSEADKRSPQQPEQSGSMPRSASEPDAETLVNVYRAETFEIHRKGYVVSIFDITNDSKEPIFEFEQRGQKIDVLRDEITNKAEIYKKFETASDNLETMKSRGQSVKNILSDKTHRAQVAVFGELSPRGSTAIATGYLLTSNTEKVRTLAADSGRQMSYERQVRIREGSEQPYDIIIVSKDGVPPRDSTIAISEDGSILSQNHPSDYPELRQNYEIAKEEHQALKQAAEAAEELRQKPVLRNNSGGFER